MIVATVEILKLPVSLGSGEFPLLTSASQSLSSYLIKSFEGVRVTEDLVQTVKVPYFDGYSGASMVRMGGRLYWIVDVSTSTDSAHSLMLHLSLCGPSLLHKGDSVKGDFSRLPTNACSWFPRSAKSGGLTFDRSVKLSTLPTTGSAANDRQLFWVQITSSDYLDTTVEHDRMCRYGFFTAIGEDMTPLGVFSTHKTAESGPTIYPSLMDLINDPERFGFTASTILDISISVRCPYQTVVETVTGYNNIGISGSGADACIREVKIGDVTYVYYVIDKSVPSFPMHTTIQSVSFTATERQTGNVTLRDHNGNPLAVIDPSVPLSSIGVTCVSDFGSLLTQVEINDSIYTIPEGHVPWLGNAWDEYRKFSLAYDRESMEQSIAFAHERTRLGIAQSAASTAQNIALGAIGGGFGTAVGAVGGVASLGLSTWAALREQDISQRESRASQDLAERRVQGQAGTAYNAGYGLIYCWQCIKSPACIQLDRPGGWTASIDNAYTDAFGFPAEGVRIVSLTSGYYRGRIYATNSINGYLLDKINGSLMQGVKFKEV